MKKFSFLALAAAGLLLGACSSSDETSDVQNQAPVMLEGAYVGITLQLPSATAPLTRANENFQEGSTEEFAIKDATLYIFKGATEAGATYVGSYAIPTTADDPTKDGTQTDNVETTIVKATLIDADVAAEIKNSNAATNYYAYVIINSNGQVGSLDKNTTFADFSKREFSSIGADIAKSANIHAGGLLMTSSPLSKVQGGLKTLDATAQTALTTATNYETLVALTKNNIFASEAEAIANPAGCVFVERAAVKITVSEDIETQTVGGYSYNFLGWQIINYEPTYYNTRQIEAGWGNFATTLADADASSFTEHNTVRANNFYRFVSCAPLAPQIPSGHEATSRYRTYFAKDLHYNQDFNLQKPVANETDWITFGESGYTTENTFDVVRQKWQNTTQITIKLQFNGGAPFYMVNGDDAIYKSTDKDFATQENDYLTETTAAAKAALEAKVSALPTVQNAISTAIDHFAASGKTYTGKVEITLPTLAKNTAAGPVAISDITYTVVFTPTNGGDPLSWSEIVDVTSGENPGLYKTDIVSAINAALGTYTVNVYHDGLAYYNVRIKHFGDYETPWSATKPFQTVTPGTTVDQIYGATSDANYEKNFLGRYGVVRDNWYRLTVKGVNKIGSAVPVDVSGTGKGTPDDEIENYISVHVHMLPWVIRTQSINL